MKPHDKLIEDIGEITRIIEKYWWDDTLHFTDVWAEVGANAILEYIEIYGDLGRNVNVACMRKTDYEKLGSIPRGPHHCLMIKTIPRKTTVPRRKIRAAVKKVLNEST